MCTETFFGRTLGEGSRIVRRTLGEESRIVRRTLGEKNQGSLGESSKNARRTLGGSLGDGKIQSKDQTQRFKEKSRIVAGQSETIEESGDRHEKHAKL